MMPQMKVNTRVICFINIFRRHRAPIILLEGEITLTSVTSYPLEVDYMTFWLGIVSPGVKKRFLKFLLEKKPPRRAGDLNSSCIALSLPLSLPESVIRLGMTRQGWGCMYHTTIHTNQPPPPPAKTATSGVAGGHHRARIFKLLWSPGIDSKE